MEYDRDSLSGIDIITRNSMHSLRSHSQVSLFIREAIRAQVDDRNWSWSYLRKRFRERGLEGLFARYRQRLQHSYFSVYLLFSMAVCTAYIVVLLSLNWNNLEDIFSELAGQVVTFSTCFTLMVILYNEKVFLKHPHLQITFSCIMVCMITMIDNGIAIYMSYLKHVDRTSWTFVTLIGVYVYLPLPRKWHCALAGTVVSLVHLITISLFTYRGQDLAQLVAADAIYCFCTNAVGMFYRFVTEITVRRTFLDRRACIESTYKLKYEKDQEERLLLSILPKHIAYQVKKDIRGAIHDMTYHRRPMPRKPFSELYVEKHHNVSILYADIVNFTPLTRTLTASELVETLNELFGKFDDAADKSGCLRIKILGDCYYCVSGVPTATSDHAKNSVKMGLAMIEVIRNIREEREMDIDMRIGIHSGSILSGLMGICKWQFDIWSRDVTIANHMEQSGKPGRVHITMQTRDILGNEYEYEPGYGELHSEYLSENNIETFLVVPPTPKMSNGRSDLDRVAGIHGGNGNIRKGSLAGPVSMKIQDYKRKSSGTTASRRRTVLMDESLACYQRMLNLANSHMKNAIDKMPLNKYDQWCYPDGINPLSLTFDDVKWEIPYQKQPDPLFKFYTACAFFILGCMAIIQSLALHSSFRVFWITFGSSAFLAVVLLPCEWIGYAWNRMKDPHRELDMIPPPPAKILRFFCYTSELITTSWTARTVIFILVSLAINMCAIIDVYFTYSCALGIMATSTFFRVHFIFKFLVSATFVVVFSIIATLGRPLMFQEGVTVSTGLGAVASHIFYLTLSAAIFHIMDRQMEYIGRLDFKWKRQLTKEQEEASTTRVVNKLLLQNILPAHVADIYLNVSRSPEELYHEEYAAVSVMFASIPNYVDFYTENDFNDHGLRCLQLLNEIICDFDRLLFEPQFSRIEKIKVVGSTYMAACGLQPGRKGSSEDSVDVENEKMEGGVNAATLVKFAAAMFVVLNKMNKDALQDFQLRIGIDCGPVMAGVVGAGKPLYDIWGNTVNMASRMDSTGVSGKIQVTEECAEKLMLEGLSCECRGRINVKGRGFLTTYTVCLDEQFNPVDDADDLGSTYL